jgi:hypothetical protein
MKPQDPPRLLDPASGAPSWLRSSLEAGTLDVPGPARMARIAARLPGGLTGSGPTGSGPSAPRPPVAPPVAPPLLPAVPSVFSGAAIGVALGLAVVGADWLVSPRAADPPPPPAPIALTAAALEPLPLEPAKPPSPLSRPPSSRPLPLPGATTASPAASGGLDPAAPAADVGAPTGPVVAEPDPLAAEPESSILKRAQDALRSNPAQALAITDLHLARYPGGSLVQEREVLAITALLGMGRASEARARATRFVASFPTSADCRRLAVLIPDLETSPSAHKNSGGPPSTP